MKTKPNQCVLNAMCPKGKHDAQVRFDWMRDHKKGDTHTLVIFRWKTFRSIVTEVQPVHKAVAGITLRLDIRQTATTDTIQNVGHKMAQHQNKIQIATREMSITELNT